MFAFCQVAERLPRQVVMATEIEVTDGFENGSTQAGELVLRLN